MTAKFIIAVIAGALASLLVAIRRRERTLEVLSKSAASAGLVVLGVSRWSADDGFATWVLAGLALCALGDVLLLSDRSFDLGLVAFLLGHVAYVIAFSLAQPIASWPPVTLVPLLVAGVVAMRWLWPHLGRRRVPVSAYVVTITVMVWGGVSAAAAGAVSWIAAVGAGLFYLSDLAVARHRFVTPEFINRGLGLPLYYAGQVMIAMAV